MGAAEQHGVAQSEQVQWCSAVEWAECGAEVQHSVMSRAQVQGGDTGTAQGSTAGARSVFSVG